MKKILSIFIIATTLLLGCEDSSDIGPSSFEGGGTSQGGSLARFAIYNDFLYVVDNLGLIPVEISSLTNPVSKPKVDIGVGIETIFPYNDHLFIGSSSAMFIYDLVNPAQPRQVSTYVHATGCDPVVVNGDYAYVTLREGISCANPISINVLEVVDVSNYRNPIQLNSIFLSNPRGLGIGCDNKLFVCDGDRGLVQFSLDNPANPIQDTVYTSHAANDVIVRDDLVIVTGDDGIYQYRCSQESLELLSSLPIAF